MQHCRSLTPLNTLRKQHLMFAITDAVEVMVCKGDTLFTESEAPESLFYLLSGEVLLKSRNNSERIITADFHWLPIVQFHSERFSATALTDCQLLKFNRYQLDRLLTWSQVADYLEIDVSYNRDIDEDASWITTILNSNLFYKIPPLNILSIRSHVSAINVKEGEMVIREGESGDYCYFIKEGRAQVLLGEQAESDVVKPIVEIGSGRCFGEDALIQNTVRSASVKMLTDGILMRLHKTEFQHLLKEPSVNTLHFETLDSLQDSNIEFLDVRTQEEFDYKHIRNALHIPLTLLRLKVRVLDPEKHYLLYCNTGSRSRAAATLLQEKGYQVSLLKGGLGRITQQQVDSLLTSELDIIYQQASSHV